MDTRKAPGETLVGSTIAGRYELCRPLARGGMGAVYGGRDHRLCRPVAVKVIPLGEATSDASPRTGRQWWWEARVMAAVRHPHVVQLYETFRDRAYGYVVMELVQGDDLGHYLARTGPLPCGEALRIGIQVCHALQTLHRRGFIHCDIKPGNLLRTPEGCVKLTDFGIAQTIGSSRHGFDAPPGVSAESSDILFGTAAYCSPEQALCDPLTGATDLYSLGVVLFELLAGVPPYVGETAEAVLKQHTDTRVPALRRLRAGMPVVVEQPILRALAKNPSERFTSARAMCAALESARAALRSTAARTPLRPCVAALASDDSQRSPPSRGSRDDAERIAAVERQTTAIISGPVGPRAAQGSRFDTTVIETAYDKRGWDGEMRGYTTDVLPTAIARTHVQRTRGIAVVLLCIADVVGLLLLIMLVSWVH